MNIYSPAKKFRKNQEGATIIEFALLAPILFMLTLGTLDFMLGFLDYLRMNDAVRQAARVAFIEDPVADISTLDSTNASCAYIDDQVNCGSYPVSSAQGFNNILAAAQAKFPKIEAENLVVTYSESGVGTSSTAGGTVPIVTVSISGYQHQLILANLIPGVSHFAFPSFSTSRMKPY